MEECKATQRIKRPEFDFVHVNVNISPLRFVMCKM